MCDFICKKEINMCINCLKSYQDNDNNEYFCSLECSNQYNHEKIEIDDDSQ